MPVPLAHESASNAGGSARSPPLGRQAGHASRGCARRTLHSSPCPWGAYPHRPPLSRRHCDTRRTSRLSRSGGREAGWLGMSQALGLSAPLRVHSPLAPPYRKKKKRGKRILKFWGNPELQKLIYLNHNYLQHIKYNEHTAPKYPSPLLSLQLHCTCGLFPKQLLASVQKKW